MKCSFILLINVFFLYNISIGQPIVNDYHEKIDSIQNLLNSSSADDTIKVMQLNEIAELCFFDLQYKRGFLAARQAKALAKKLDFAKGEGLYYSTIAVLNEHYFKLYYEKKAFLAFRDSNDGFINFKKPVLTYELLEKSSEQIVEDLKFFEQQKDQEAILILANNLMWYDYYLGHAEKNLQMLDTIINKINENNIDPESIIFQIEKAGIWQRTNRAIEAKKLEGSIVTEILTVTNRKESALIKVILYNYYSGTGNYAKAIEGALNLNNELVDSDMKTLKISVLELLGVNFAYLSMSAKSVEYYKKAIAMMEEINYNTDAIRINFNMAFELVELKELEAAKKYFLKARDLSEQTKDSILISVGNFRYLDGMGQILMAQDKCIDALNYFHRANEVYSNFSNGTSAYIDFYIAQCQQKLGNLMASIQFGEKCYKPSLQMGDQRLTLKICILLYEVYEQSGKPLKAFEYLKKYRIIIKEKEDQDVANRAANFEIQSLVEKNQIEKDRLEKDKLKKEQENQNQRWWLVSIAGALLSTFVLLYILIRNNTHKQKANALLQQQKEEINVQKNKSEATLSDLKSTQAQLIQSEKMASLGELTAGIAHEIQNPLNFVNNFSEVNKELLEELKAERLKPNAEKDGQTEDEIINDVIDNSEKINHHGKRAGDIVKGMLQHSRSSTGVKEPIDINALADEYLRLSYHGLRAKDKDFNATMKTDFDEGIGKINIISQDIGRVLLNLFNNAFYAVNEYASTGSAGQPYEPTVSVSTKKLENHVIITVSDNGNGIPQKIVDKIFQPFFTTKPTGQGTGLGLSLSYDIIKAHGGEIEVGTKEGEETTFIIQLPLNN